MRKLLMAALVGALVSWPVEALAKDPNRSDYWLEQCADGSQGCFDFIFGMQQGMTAAWSFIHRTQAEKGWAQSFMTWADQCEPEGVNLARIADIWVAYLLAHPEERRLSPWVTLIKAKRQAFACPK